MTSPGGELPAIHFQQPACFRRGSAPDSVGLFEISLQRRNVSAKSGSMTSVNTIHSSALASKLDASEACYKEIQERGLKLDMTRGKPSAQQLDLAGDLMTAVIAEGFASADGTSAANVIVGGASSLTLMHDVVVRALLHGVPDGLAPWSKSPVIRIAQNDGRAEGFGGSGVRWCPKTTESIGGDKPPRRQERHKSS